MLRVPADRTLCSITKRYTFAYCGENKKKEEYMYILTRGISLFRQITLSYVTFLSRVQFFSLLNIIFHIFTTLFYDALLFPSRSVPFHSLFYQFNPMLSSKRVISSSNRTCHKPRFTGDTRARAHTKRYSARAGR